MDRKSILIVVICVAAIFLWSSVIVPKMYPRKPQTASTGEVATASSPMMGTNTPSSPATNTSSAVVAEVTNGFVTPDVPEELLVVSNDNARYTFTSYGGGLKEIDLIHYPETVDCLSKKKGGTNGLAALNDDARVPVLAFLNSESWQRNGAFELTRTPGGVRAELSLSNGLRVIKEFNPTTNYLVDAVVRIENTTDEPIVLPAQDLSIGTATPMGPTDNGMAVGLLWYDGAKPKSVTSRWFSNPTFGCFPGTPRPVYRDGNNDVVWAAVHNQFFTLVAMPEEPAQSVVSRRYELPVPTNAPPSRSRKKITPMAYETSLIFPSITVPPRGSYEKKFHFYGGPKEYRTLARLGAEFDNKLDLVMQFGRFFGFFSKALLLSMNGIHSLGLAYGWTIIVITILIKALFWPLTNASTKSMKRMSALQPQMKAIQEKYKDDPMKAQRKVMEFMKEHKVSPMGSCLPMLLQMPVFIGFFYMIRTAIELRGQSFLWACDLSATDTIFIIPGLGFIPYLGIPDVGFPINPLPLLMGATMLWQSHMTPPSPGVDPAQQKIMRYMPLMFVVFLYNYSAGLALYWSVNNLLSVLQTKLTKAKSDPVTVTPATPNPAPLQKKKKKKR